MRWVAPIPSTGGASPFRCGFYLYAVFRGVIGSVCLLRPAPLRSAVIAATCLLARLVKTVIQDVLWLRHCPAIRQQGS